MKIDENFTIEPDAYQWTLTYKSKVVKDGKVVTSTKSWYFPNVRLALLHYLDECIKPAKEIQDIIKRIEEAMDKINDTRTIHK